MYTTTRLTPIDVKIPVFSHSLVVLVKLCVFLWSLCEPNQFVSTTFLVLFRKLIESLTRVILGIPGSVNLLECPNGH